MIRKLFNSINYRFISAYIEQYTRIQKTAEIDKDPITYNYACGAIDACRAIESELNRSK